MSEYTVVKATIKDSTGKKCVAGETAMLTDESAANMLRAGHVKKGKAKK